jgi:hypothetical protein
MSNLPGVIQLFCYPQDKGFSRPWTGERGRFGSPKFVFPVRSGVRLGASSFRIPTWQIKESKGSHVWRTSASFWKVVRLK